MNHAQQMEAAKKRREKIVAMYLQKNPRLSMREIGLKVEPQITPQRVGAILKTEGVKRD